MQPFIQNQLLIQLLRLGGETISSPDLNKAVCAALNRDIPVGTLSMALKGLIDKGFITRSEGAPRPVRGGRRCYYYQITDLGRAELTEQYNKAKELRLLLKQQGLLALDPSEEKTPQAQAVQTPVAKRPGAPAGRAKKPSNGLG